MVANAWICANLATQSVHPLVTSVELVVTSWVNLIIYLKFKYFPKFSNSEVKGSGNRHISQINVQNLNARTVITDLCILKSCHSDANFSFPKVSHRHSSWLTYGMAWVIEIKSNNQM